MKESVRRNIIKIVFAAAGAVMIGLYKLLSLIPGCPEYIYEHIVHPMHYALSSACDPTRIAVAEIVIGALVIICVFGLIGYIISFFHRPGWIREGSYGFGVFIFDRLFSLIMSVVMLFCLIYGGFCMMWGFCYASGGVTGTGLIAEKPDGVLHSDLIRVDEYFLSKANEYSEKVQRDAEGHFVYSGDPFEHALTLYDAVSEHCPALGADNHRPKPVRFSRIVSYMDFTGFFFPFTGEACINTDSPACMTPSTIAHEMAHQKGISAEDEANFVAVVACMEDGDDDFVYSASLLALIHLQNAVRKSGDAAEWTRIRDMYSAGVNADLDANSVYWSALRNNPAHKVTTTTYDGFLKSYDQEKGRETYGACVDLLVEYYSGM